MKGSFIRELFEGDAGQVCGWIEDIRQLQDKDDVTLVKKILFKRLAE